MTNLNNNTKETNTNKEGMNTMNNTISNINGVNINMEGMESMKQEQIEKVIAGLRKIYEASETNASLSKYRKGLERVLNSENPKAKELVAMYKIIAKNIKEQGKGKAILTKHSQVQAKRSEILKNSYISFGMVDIFQEMKALNYNILYVNAPLSRITRTAKTEDYIVVPTTGKNTVIKTKEDRDPYTKDIFKIHFQNTAYIEMFKYEGIYIVLDGADSKMFIPSNKTKDNQKLWYDPKDASVLLTETELKNLEKVNPLTKQKEKLDVRHYKFLSFSPSDTRIGNGMMKDVTNGDDRVEFLNSQTGNAWTLEENKIKAMAAEGKDVTVPVLKTMPRFGQLHAGSVVVGKFNNWAMYTAKFKTTHGTTADGTGFVLDTAVARMFQSRLNGNVEIKPSAVRGMFIQARPLLFKGAFLVVSQKVMKRLYKKHVAKLDKDGQSLVNNYGVIKNDCPEFFVDANIVKADSEFDKFADCLEFEVLDIAKASNASLSKQLIEKAMVKDPVATSNWLNDFVATNIYNGFKERFVDKTSKVLTLGQIANPFATDIIESIAPSYAKNTGAIYRAMLDNQVKANMKALDKLKMLIEGKNTRLISEHTELFTEALSLIKYGEIFSPSANKYFNKAKRQAPKVRQQAEEALKAGDKETADSLNKLADKMEKDTNYIVAIKYPSMGIKEYYYAKVLTLTDIKERIDVTDLDEEDKNVLFSYFRSIEEGVTMLPAREEIMRQCAGLDFDYDGWTEIYNYDLVDILASDEYFIVDCE